MCGGTPGECVLLARVPPHQGLRCLGPRGVPKASVDEGQRDGEASLRALSANN